MDTCLEDQQQTSKTLSARQLLLSGHVQGVGFRPFIYRLARKHELAGWVRNRVGIVEIFVQGRPEKIDFFLREIFSNKPAIAKPKLETDISADIADIDSFSILHSEGQVAANNSVPSDLFLCDDCLAELHDPGNRRYRYPFINCTQCGPRYTLIRSLPYDRDNTTMSDFQMCSACRAEYDDPEDRRFHAEPIACPECGPSLSLGKSLDKNNKNKYIEYIVKVINDGKIVAVKGIGGYHLMCDATNDEAVARLREKKQRPHKPLAVMFPAPVDKPFFYAEKILMLSENDKEFLLQPARPVLMVRKKEPEGDVSDRNETDQLSESISPGLNEVGMMMPYSPLHHLLLDEFSGPLVATSANISGEPVLTDNDDVEDRLSHVADFYLHHDRPIERPADDPVFRNVSGQPRPIRTGRGSSPLELALPFTLDRTVLAVGAHMKNTIALAWADRAVISPHIGEMDSARSLDVFENTITDLQSLYGVEVEQLICDAHPGYTTTRWANKQKLPVDSVLHHHAHASAAYYECKSVVEADKEIIMFSWDGVGYGEDATLWGGETFLGKPAAWQRVATMKPFYLPGGDKAGRQPWRSAAAVCWEAGLAYDQIPEKDSLLQQAWQKSINSPQTSSVGRLFDAAAALTGVCSNASFEGQAPMEFEARCERYGEQACHTVELDLESTGKLLNINWKPLMHTMLDSTLSAAARSAIFHDSLAQCILNQALLFREKYQVNTVGLSGGVFQNRVLTEKAIDLLATENFEVWLPMLIPVNDAGICFGQIIEYGYKNNRPSS
jgi:hydrogenase maturation protein HypF